MALGILEPKGRGKVPGTTRYFDDPSRSQTTNPDDEAAPRLKTHGNIILIPQPSDDPNDPLNWPLWQRDLITFILCFAGVMATALGPILADNTITLARHYTKTLTEVAVLTGYFLLGAGAAAVFFVPSGRVWGKRHLFLLGIVIVIASSAWGGAARDSYKSMIGARILQGVGTAPFESLLIAAIGDLYHVHQRGIRMAFANLAVFGGAFFTPIVVGKISNKLGLEWPFYFVSIFMALTLPLVFFYCPETAYRRDARFNIDANTDSDSEARLSSAPPPSYSFAQTNGNGASAETGSNGADKETNSSVEQKNGSPDSHGKKASICGLNLLPLLRITGLDSRINGFDVLPQLVLFPSLRSQHMGDASTPKKTTMESCSLFDGTKTDERYWTLLLRPFPLIINPAFLWGCLIQGAMIGWTIFLGIIVSAVFIGPPNLWGEVMAGYAYTGAFVGAVGGFIVSGLLADFSVRLMTRWNGGIYEPEFRILLVIPMLIIGGIGLFGFALTAEGVMATKYSYMVPLVFFGFEVAGMVIGAVASSLYIVDAYRDLTIEAFTLMIIFKNFFSFALTFFALDWMIQNGIQHTLIVISSVQVGICVLSVPMYILGKHCRSFFHRHDPLKATGLV